MAKLTQTSFYKELCELFPELKNIKHGINTTIDINEHCALFTQQEIGRYERPISVADHFKKLLGMFKAPSNTIAVHLIDCTQDIEYVLSIDPFVQCADVLHKFKTNLDDYRFPFVDDGNEPMLTSRTECLSFIQHYFRRPASSPML